MQNANRARDEHTNEFAVVNVLPSHDIVIEYSIALPSCFGMT